MRDQGWFNLVAGIAAVLVVVLGAVLMAYPSVNGLSPAARSGTVGNPTVYRNLTIALNPSTGEFDYTSTLLAAPLGVTTVFTITNYDPGIAYVPASSDARVVGTVGNVMWVEAGGHGVQVSSIAMSDTSHTFSISSGAYHLNVPIPPAGMAGQPTKVTFSVIFTLPGSFNWGCIVLCGPMGMVGRDAMWGTISVS